MRPDAGLRKKISFSTMPWVSRRLNGSSNVTRPRSRMTLVQKREYSRCRIACSMPPMYWSTGSQYLTRSSTMAPPLSARRSAVVPGRVDEGVHGVGLAPRRRRTSGRRSRGSRPRLLSGLPEPSGTQSSGSTTGNWSSGTGTSPHFAVDERDRAAPVALARDAPVAQAPGDLLVAEPLGLEVGGDGVDRLLGAEAVVLAGIHAAAGRLVGVPLLPGVERSRPCRRRR
jgi:hypothetical protein